MRTRCLRLLPLATMVLAGLACSTPKDNQTTGMGPGSADDGADDGSGTLGPAPTSGVDDGDDGLTTSPTSGDSSGGEDGDATEGGLTFIVPPDGGPGIFECDLFAQDCMAGEKCMPWASDGGSAWNSTRCSPIDANPAQTGDECMVEGSGVSGVDNCDIGLMCWNVDENGLGICEDMCTGSSDNPICENPDDVCSIANDGAIVLCLAACDPLIQDCEIENEVCYPIADDWACAPDASGEMGAYGDPCEYINACDPGSVCAGAAAFTNCTGAIGCCSTVCDITEPNADADCQGLDPGQSCEAWYTEGMAPPGYENVGVCALPA